MATERFIIGDSEDVEAEYGSRDDAPVTVLEAYEGEIYSYWGAQNITDARQRLLSDGVARSQIEIL